MGVTTTRFDLSEGAWTEVAAGKRSVSLMTDGVSAVIVHVGAVVPAIDTPDYLVMTAGAGNAINLSGLGAADKVFARGYSSYSRVIVLAGDE